MSPHPKDPTSPRDPALRDLLERRAIVELVECYSRAVDRRDYALLESLYTEDGIDDHAGLYCGPAAGFVAWLEGALAGVDATTHHVHNVTLALDLDLGGDRGDDLDGKIDDRERAEGEVYVSAYNRIRNPDGSLAELEQGLRYLDHYRRDASGWRFARRTVVCDWARLGPAFWDPAHPLLAGKRFGRDGADDASYAVLTSPIFARGPRRAAGSRRP
ncbi:MAG: nuclear transport factor 2 family protein [Deltaproteobacteria bacterium]|nr:nuclear transport factor 2 family protein [Deltaproteobacteria bacterium]